MPRGKHPLAYFENANVNKPIDQIFSDLDSFSDEAFEGETERQSVMSTFMLLPPLLYDGHFVKGVLFTHGADLLVARNPRLKELFHIYAYSMWSSVPTSAQADGLFTGYPNAAREAWFKAKNPERAEQIWVPLCDSDFFNHYRMAPAGVTRDIDVLCVARLDAVKNLPMFARALRVMNQRNPGRKIRAVLASGRNIDVNWSQLGVGEKIVLAKMTEALGVLPAYLHLEPQYRGDMANLYSRARCLVLPSLIEGKNRAIHEAMSCDTPVVTFEAYNQYARGGHPILPKGGGLTAPAFTPESLADTIETVLNTGGQFKPRQAVLEVSGREHVFNTCIDALPYYAKEVPGYVKGQMMHNRWIDLAMQGLYKTSLHNYMYGETKPSLWTKGMDKTETLIRIFEKLLPIRDAMAARRDGQAAAVVAPAPADSAAPSQETAAAATLVAVS